MSFNLKTYSLAFKHGKTFQDDSSISLVMSRQAVASLSSVWFSGLLIYFGNQSGKCTSCLLLGIQTF